MTTNRVSKAFCFTYFPGDDEFKQRSDFDFEPLRPVFADLQSSAKEIIVGRELCGTTGRLHLQGYIKFKSAKRWNAVKKLLMPGTHIEIAKGTSQDNWDYCSKEEDVVFTHGEPAISPAKQQQKRWDDTMQCIREGRISDICSEFMIRYTGNIERLIARHGPKPTDLDTLDNRLYTGPTGTGKSSSARREFPEAYIKMPNKWFDGYNGEEVIIIEELSPDHEYLGPVLKCWTDHYPFRCEIKGASLFIRPKKVIITSNYTLDQIFKDPAVLEPLKRRIKTTHFLQPFRKIEKAPQVTND